MLEGNEDFRKKSKSYIQFQNEIYLYEKILPFFKNFLKNKETTFNPDNWIPKTYVNICLETSNVQRETILVQENLKASGFSTFEKLYLTESHFDLMIDNLAQFHSVSLALKISKNQKFTNLVKNLKPLSFEDPNGEKCVYDVLHEISTTRLFKNVLEAQNLDEKVLRDVQQLQRKVGSSPVKLFDTFREIDDFSVIVHGDFNRNNLMFKQDSNFLEMRMIDFQQVRFASPCLDLAFFMYVNIDPAERNKLWEKLLLKYHEKLLTYITEILKIEKDDFRLKPLNLENFLEHCKKKFLYGLLITVSFTPWLIAPQAETQKVGKLFQANMFDVKYREFALHVGGEKANRRMVEDVQHASRMGYFDICYE
ncbi:uncharacterized protein LOC134837891 [Culicoides brevitarsis]|uniref:uncharacterized protein LOC134837891 n=1 Tax=Culicoides brevitarsis TaxID=469753 RepID=UPI00307BF189